MYDSATLCLIFQKHAFEEQCHIEEKKREELLRQLKEISDEFELLKHQVGL